MLKFVLILVFLATSGVTIAFGESDIWKLAKAGKVSCLVPDMAKKTCEVMTSFALDADGTVTSTETARFPLQPDLIITARTRGHFRGGRFCYKLSKDAFQVVAINRSGVPVVGSEFASTVDQFSEINRPIYGHEFCAEFSPSGVDGSFVVRILFDGTATENGEFPGVWVDPSTGFELPR